MINYKTKIKLYYHLCVVVKAKASGDGVVRTVTVSLRNRRAVVLKLLPNEEFEVGVQRLILILPEEEASKQRVEEDLKNEILTP